MTVWMDLTNSLVVWKQGMVGLVRAELMIARKLYETNPEIRFSICTGYGFREVKYSEISWLLHTDNLVQAYKEYQESKHSLAFRAKGEFGQLLGKSKRYVARKLLKTQLLYPFSDGDTVFSCGWYGSKKEDLFSKLKQELPTLVLVYTIYDLVMVKEGLRHYFYPRDISFDCYLEWIFQNCDAIIFGGETAKKDCESYFAERGWAMPPSRSVKFGSDILSKKNPQNIEAVLERHGIQKPYILAVGTLDPKKNYKVLYDAYCILVSEKYDLIPELVICGQELETKDLISKIKLNPLTKDKIKIFSFNDDELEVLYQNCQFGVLPTLYEGSSVVLPETLDHGKLCLCSKVAPLLELGGDFPYYLDPKRPKEWSEAIKRFMDDITELRRRENNIKNNWKPITWKRCAEDIDLKLKDLVVEVRKNEKIDKIPAKNLYVDISLFFYKSFKAGIPRAQLLLARHIAKQNPHARFFSLHLGRYVEIPRFYVKNLVGDQPLDVAIFSDSKNFPQSVLNHRADYPFNKGDVVFSAGVGFKDSVYNALQQLHDEKGFTFVQLIYDFTPILLPHTHHEETVANYPKFLKRTYDLADYVIYGGCVAQSDGNTYQQQQKQNLTPSFAIKFGSDIKTFEASSEKVTQVLNKFEVKGDFLLTVGTMEARKNHELLYEAYLELMRSFDVDELPQLIICGNPGWKTNDFQHLLKTDVRIRGKVIWITPTDEELDILYKNCKFTLLASLYEGWSLTLPESLNYGKFCIASDVPPLKEVGLDIIDYACPYDPVEWAEKINYYLKNPDQLQLREEMIKSKWENTTWSDCGKRVNSILKGLIEQ